MWNLLSQLCSSGCSDASPEKKQQRKAEKKKRQSEKKSGNVIPPQSSVRSATSLQSAPFTRSAKQGKGSLQN